MCPLWPLHFIILYLLAVLTLWLLINHVTLASSQTFWNVSFYPPEVNKIPENEEWSVYFGENSPLNFAPDKVEVISADQQIAEVTSNQTLYFNTTNSTLSGNLSFGLTGKFLGYTSVKLRASDADNVAESKSLPVSVIRPKNVIDVIFVASISVLLALNYINMGCSLDMEIVKKTCKRPIGPAVGLVSQYLFMPLVSFALSYIIFDSPNMRLGLFTVGCSPGGGASNMWTYLLGGSLNLSITMTFISNVLAFVAMPLWLFTLGRIIFESSNIKIPYTNIISTLLILIFPIAIGLLIQRYLPNLAKFCKKILGPFGGFMILFIVVFGIFSNLYMFSLFNWRVVVGGLGVPWLGYAFGAILAKLFKFSLEDIIAIAVETGIQNSGIAIVLLRFSLPQPDADLTSVIPVAASVMMPIPLLCLLIIFKIMKRNKSYDKHYEIYDDTMKADPEVVQANTNSGLIANSKNTHRF